VVAAGMRIALVLALIAGCSSQYMPRAPGLVAVTVQDGKLVYMRDGQSYPHGLLGGGLVDAVAGNPLAVAAARHYHAHMRDGFIVAMLGLAAMFGGTVAFTTSLDSENGGNRGAIGAGCILGGMVMALVGAAYAAGAEPYRWDAINLFNDGARAVPSGPPGLRAAAAPSATLHMRD